MSRLGGRVSAGAIIASVLAFAVLTALGWFLFERVEEVVDRGYRGKAAIHPYYALEQLFESSGLPTRSLPRLRILPPLDHVLWIATAKRSTNSQRLVQWANEGGHLVVNPTGPWTEDPLLQALGIQRFGATEADEDDDQSLPAFASERPSWPRLYLQDPTEVLYSEGAEDAAWMLTIRVGDGTATVLADGKFLHTERIGHLDHALIAWHAAIPPSGDPTDGPTDLPAGLWLLYRDPGPSIWSLISERTQPIVISLVLLILASLTVLTRRFGPLQESSPKDRRQLVEHVSASGNFLWNIGCETTLIEAARQALARRLGRGRQLSANELETLARQSSAAAKIDEADLQRALTTWETRDRQEFTRVIQILETLRRSS